MSAIIRIVKAKDLHTLKTKLGEKFNDDIGAIDRILALLQQENKFAKGTKHKLEITLTTTTPMTKPLPASEGYTDMVRGGLEKVSDQFNIKDVIAAIRETYPTRALDSDAIARVLFRFKKSGKIEVVEAASGRRPAIYRKIKK